MATLSNQHRHVIDGYGHMLAPPHMEKIFEYLLPMPRPLYQPMEISQVIVRIFFVEEPMMFP